MQEVNLANFLKQAMACQIKWLYIALVVSSMLIANNGLTKAASMPGEVWPGTGEAEAAPEPPPSLELQLEAPVSLILPEVRGDEAVPPAPRRSCMPTLPPNNEKKLVTPACVVINGMHRQLPKNLHKGGGLLWQDTSVGRVWRLQITSPGAHGLRVHFKKFKVGRGRVWIHSPNGQIDGPYTGKGLHKDGRFWGTYMFSDTVTIEYLPDAEASQQQSVPFRLVQVNHMLEKMPGQ